jgi:hypothetical protein
MRNEHFSAKQEAYTDISRKEKWQSPKGIPFDLSKNVL